MQPPAIQTATDPASPLRHTETPLNSHPPLTYADLKIHAGPCDMHASLETDGLVPVRPQSSSDFPSAVGAQPEVLRELGEV